MGSGRRVVWWFALSVAGAGALAAVALASASAGYFAALPAAPVNLQRGGASAPLPDGQVLIVAAE